MNSLFFWIIILSFVIPMAMRMYRKSVNKRSQGPGFPGQFPGGPFGGNGQNPGQQNRQPRDGYTQQDYMSGGYRQIMSPQPLPPGEPLPPLKPVPPMDQQFPAPGQTQPFGDSRQYGQPPHGQPQDGWRQPDPREAAPTTSPAPGTPPPPSAPQGYRARKLAELDQQYSNGELAMEEYMKRRSDIMNG